MRTTGDVREREQWFGGSRSVVDAEAAPESPIAERVDHRSIIPIASSTARLEHHLVHATCLRFVDQTFEATTPPAFSSRWHTVVAHHEDRQGMREQVEP